MNSRYLIVLLLLGGIVYGLTTAVGGMLAEDEPMSVCSAQVEWSSVPNVGVSAPAERSFSVPVSSHRSGSLFHYPAMYSGASVPQGYASVERATGASVLSGSGLTTGVPSSGTYAVSSAYSPSQELYLTSSAVLQSYGGGAESGMYASLGSHSAVSSVSPSSASDMSVHTWSSLSVGPQQHSLSDMSWYAQRSTYSSSVGAFASADRTLAASQSAPRRGGIRKAPGTIGGTLDNWIQGLDHSGSYWHGEENGIWYFYENELRALYESAIANGDLPVGTTWEQFLKWFGTQSDKYQFYSAPLPNGVGVLFVWALLYAVAVFVRNRKNVCSTESETH